MSKKSEHVKAWRRRTKQRIIDAFGGKCGICGYNKCQSALDLHHLNPDEKEFGLGNIRANSKSWAKIVIELRKCVLLCKNCHGEIHENIIQIPQNIPRFDENYVDYKRYFYSQKEYYDTCPICKGKKLKQNITCSPQCAARRARKIDWDSTQILELKSQGLPNVQIADKLGVSDVTIAKWLKKSQP